MALHSGSSLPVVQSQMANVCGCGVLAAGFGALSVARNLASGESAIATTPYLCGSKIVRTGVLRASTYSMSTHTDILYNTYEYSKHA